MTDQICLFISNLTIGGAERVVVNLSKGLSDLGYDVEIVLVERKGKLLQDVPESVTIVELNIDRLRRSIPPLIKNLRSKQPRALISFSTGSNVMAILANQLTGHSAVAIATEHNMQSVRQSFSMKRDRMLARVAYRFADHVVGVSKGVSEDVQGWANLPKEQVRTIYNPVIEKSFIGKTYDPPEHPWFKDEDVSVAMGAGRHVEQKDFPTLIKAFALLPSKLNCRLVLLGEGELTEEYKTLIRELGIEDEVLLPGFVDNPFRYMSHSDVFVLSSKFEGLSLVLIEAMGCGTPVISTDCPHGPSEVLMGGEYGPLVPIGDATALRNEIVQTLENPPSVSKLQDRAESFSIPRVAEAYSELIDSV